MQHTSLSAFLRATRTAPQGPHALIFAEDATEVDSTLSHHLAAGFAHVLLLAGEDIALSADLAARVHHIRLDIHAPDALTATVNSLIEARPGTWMFYAYNAEYLFHPYCETRSLPDFLAFQSDERRAAVFTTVVDLYAPDLTRHPDGVSRAEAHLDSRGYHAFSRKDPDRDWQPLDRQIDLYGGLRWRFEEHVPWRRRRIDRIALFRAKTGLRLLPDHRFNDAEYNTLSCPWHHSATCAIASFRTAKALRRNPGPRAAIHSFRGPFSTPFDWTGTQLMDLGLMEPGQWF
jgi:hypothetical protein